MGVVHGKMSGCLPSTVLFIQVIFAAFFFNRQLSHQMLIEGCLVPHSSQGWMSHALGNILRYNRASMAVDSQINMLQVSMQRH